MKYKYYVLILLAFIKYQSVSAQGLDASPAGVMISHGHPKGGWMVTYTYMNMMMKNNLSGTEKVSDETIWNNYIFAPQNMRMDMHMLMGMYGLTGRLSFMVTAGYLKTYMEIILPPGTVLVHHHDGGSMTMAEDTKHTHSTSGLGDVKLWALYKLLNGEGSSLVFSLGINFPTGSFDIDAGEHAIYSGERDPYMMQLGTGTYDLMPGLTYLKKSKNITWSLQAIGTVRPFYNSIGYHYGSDITLNAWAAYQFCPFISASARLEGFTGGIIQGNDPKIYEVLEPDANPKCYGGQRTSGYAGANFYINKTFMRNSKIGVEFGIPFYQNVNGIQLAAQQTFNAGITKSF